MLNNYQELSSETETTVRLDIYEQNETNFVFLHAVLTEILKAEKKYCSIDFFAFSVWGVKCNEGRFYYDAK